MENKEKLYLHINVAIDRDTEKQEQLWNRVSSFLESEGFECFGSSEYQPVISEETRPTGKESGHTNGFGQDINVRTNLETPTNREETKSQSGERVEKEINRILKELWSEKNWGKISYEVKNDGSVGNVERIELTKRELRKILRMVSLVG